MLTIAVSARALFHMEDGHKVFEAEGAEAYDQYMRSTETKPLRPGVAFPLVRKLLKLNEVDSNGRPIAATQKVCVALLSRNSPTAGLRVMNSARHYNLAIERALFCKGTDRFRYARALGADLFLSLHANDVRMALENGIAAATLGAKEQEESDETDIRIAFDGDSVLFSPEADLVYQSSGLQAFTRHEIDKAQTPLEAGPFKNVLAKLHAVQQMYPAGESPIKLSLVTNRGMPAHERVIQTLRAWGIVLDEMVFGAGMPKGPLLAASRADIFFDDSSKNIASVTSSEIVGGHVPFGHGAIESEPLRAVA